jgi:hypothetical protein
LTRGTETTNMSRPMATRTAGRMDAGILAGRITLFTHESADIRGRAWY